MHKEDFQGEQAGNGMIWGWNEEPVWCPVLVGGTGLHRHPRTTFTPNPLPGLVVTWALTQLIYHPESGSWLCPWTARNAWWELYVNPPFQFPQASPRREASLPIREKAPSSPITLWIRVCFAVWHQRQKISGCKPQNHSFAIKLSFKHLFKLGLRSSSQAESFNLFHFATETWLWAQRGAFRMD